MMIYIGEIERRWTPGWFMVTVSLNIAPAPPFDLICVMLLVRTNTSCRYKRIKPRYIRHTKIVIFDDTLFM